MFSVLGFALSLECPEYMCGDLEDGVCAIISDDGDTISINENGCPSGKYCSLEEAFVSFDAGDQIYECDEDFTDEDDDADIEDFEQFKDFSGDQWKALPLCESQSSKNLKDGEWSDECDTDEDCELVDGSYSECECHSNGKSYCTPEFYSDYFEDWFTLCENGDANFVYVTYYLAKASMYSYVAHLDDDLDCGLDVLDEYYGWEEIESNFEDEEDDSASELILGSLLALLLLA